MDPGSDENAMAAMMGFSAFGGQDRPQKKRRYNGNADAAQEYPQTVAQAGQTASHHPAQAGSSGSGAAGPAMNNDEISLDDEDDNAPQNANVPARPSHETLNGLTARPASLPQRPPPPSAVSGPAFDAPRGPAHHHGQHQHDAWRGPRFEGCYDPRSNENPWERLEKAKGLPSLGSWISHHEQSAGATSRA
ncbi:hypothetical protein HIM_00047 [Hirsutella minnesotensis 3608]|nr:hypothetical protein HIM_00047 [Hirsutella minnesotensis 3608]